MKPIYAFDIDGILCDTRNSHKSEIEQELGVTLQESGGYDTWGFFHDSDEVMQLIRDEAMNLWRRPTVLSGGIASGQKVTKELAQRGQFAGYVTRRHPDLYADTLKWLMHHKFHFNDFGWQHVLTTPPTTRHRQLHHMLNEDDSKAGHALAMGATHLVEDSPREALQAAERMAVVVLRQPCNREFEQKIEADKEEANQHGFDCPALNISFISSLEKLL